MGNFVEFALSIFNHASFNVVVFIYTSSVDSLSIALERRSHRRRRHSELNGTLVSMTIRQHFIQIQTSAMGTLSL